MREMQMNSNTSCWIIQQDATRTANCEQRRATRANRLWLRLLACGSHCPGGLFQLKSAQLWFVDCGLGQVSPVSRVVDAATSVAVAVALVLALASPGNLLTRDKSEKMQKFSPIAQLNGMFQVDGCNFRHWTWHSISQAFDGSSN